MPKRKQNPSTSPPLCSSIWQPQFIPPDRSSSVLFSFLTEHRAVRLDSRLNDERPQSRGISASQTTGYSWTIACLSSVASPPSRKRLKAFPGYVAAQRDPRPPADLIDHRAILTRIDLDQWRTGEKTVPPCRNTSTGSMLVARDALLPRLWLWRTAWLPCGHGNQ